MGVGVFLKVFFFWGGGCWSSIQSLSLSSPQFLHSRLLCEFKLSSSSDFSGEAAGVLDPPESSTFPPDLTGDDLTSGGGSSRSRSCTPLNEFSDAMRAAAAAW